MCIRDSPGRFFSFFAFFDSLTSFIFPFDPGKRNPCLLYTSIIRWHETRNGVTGLTKECIGYENGVLGGVVSALNIFCSRGDNVLLHSPTYIGFTHSLENNGYNIVHSPLVKDENNVWRMDFEDMEKKIVDNRVHAAVFCLSLIHI